MNPQDRIHSPQDEDRLLEYLDGELPAPEARAVEMHLAACPDCRALRCQWEQLDGELAHTLALPRLSPDFAARLRQQIVFEAKAAVPDAGAKGGARLMAQTNKPANESRRLGKGVLWLGLLDGLGYGTAAAIGGYWLYHLSLAWLSGPARAGTAFLRDPAFLVALAAAAAALLVGLSLASRNRVWRWLGGL